MKETNTLAAKNVYAHIGGQMLQEVPENRHQKGGTKQSAGKIDLTYIPAVSLVLDSKDPSIVTLARALDAFAFAPHCVEAKSATIEALWHQTLHLHVSNATTDDPRTRWECINAVLEYGATKYAKNNWMRGLKYSDIINAAKRHLLALHEGVTRCADDSGLPHMDHFAANVMFLRYFESHTTKYKVFDDR